MKFEKFRSWISLLTHKYLYVLLVAGVGLVLLLWPQSQKTAAADTEAAQISAASDEVTRLETRLEGLLSGAAGVGEAEVLLTVRSSGTRQLAMDRSQSDNRQYDDSGLVERSDISSSEEHLLLSDGSGAENPCVIAESSPVYQGALIICDGGDSPSVRLSVTEAVCRLTGLTSADVTVLKKQP